MPELPEVETIVKDLNKNRVRKILDTRFLDVWTDSVKTVKKPKNFQQFRKLIKNKKIKKIWRRGKNIIFDLNEGFSLLIHQKMTGHLLYGNWIFQKGIWVSEEEGPLREKVNDYIHLMFFLDNKMMLALSDLRKFAKVELWKTEELLRSEQLKNLGPEPLEKSFTVSKLKEILGRKRGKIKQVLLDQSVIAGIGNIYADEILWQARIHPLRDVSQLNQKEIKNIFGAIKKILTKAVKLRGTSIADYRDIEGKAGFYQKVRMVYQREGEKCRRCRVKIERIKIGGRSACFCSSCQK